MNSEYDGYREIPASIVGSSIPSGGVNSDSFRAVVCGNACLERDEVAAILRAAGARVTQEEGKCLGICALEGAGAVIPEQSPSGVDVNRVILRAR